jgi:deoxyribonuclease V
VSPREAIHIQEHLRRRVILSRTADRLGTVAGADVSFRAPHAAAAVVVCGYESLQVVEETMAISPCTFPYVPGLLTFREGLILLEAIRKLHRRPDFIMFDGQGIAHPRRFGWPLILG